MATSTFTITRDSTILLSDPLTVNLAVGGTAVFGVDYTVSGAATFTITAATVLIPAGALSADIVIATLPDLVAEQNETVILSILPTDGILVPGSSPLATFTILNDDTAPSDPSWANVSFLLRADSTGFSDLKGRTITTGGATLSNIAKFDRSVLITGGINIPNPQSLISSTGDWTIDWWMRIASISPYSGVFFLDASDYPLAIGFGSALGPNLTSAVGTNTSWYQDNIPGGIPSYTQADYYGLVRSGSTIQSWKNGLQITSLPLNLTSALGIPSGFASLGLNGSSNPLGFYLEEFRITNGVARDLSIVPTQKFPNN